MADRIKFSNPINVSVQVGDTLYWTQYNEITNVASQTPALVGQVINVFFPRRTESPKAGEYDQLFTSTTSAKFFVTIISPVIV